MTKVAIMQPYFCPYIGYFQLIGSADIFVIYDNIEYTKKGWINRNRILANGEAATFSIPIKKDSDYLDVRERFLADGSDRHKLLNRIKGAYGKAPYFRDAFPTVERILLCEEKNLFGFIHHSVRAICAFLDIATTIVKSSDVAIDHGLKNQDKVIEICKALNATTYINPIGGQDLYSTDAFRNHGLDLRFLQPQPLEYRQFDAAFVPALSIIDVMMFNERQSISGDLLGRYTLL